MKKKSFLLSLIAVLAVLAAIFIYSPLKKIKEADTLLASGSYREACVFYGSAAKAFFVKDRAEAGLVSCAEAALHAEDESFLLFASSPGCPVPAGKEAAERFNAALEGLKAGTGSASSPEGESSAARLGTEDLTEAERRRQARVEAYEVAVCDHDHLRAQAVIAGMETEEDRAAYALLAEKDREEDLAGLRQIWQQRFGTGAWYTALLGDTLTLCGDPRYENTTELEADSLFTGDFGMLLITGGVPSFYGDTLGAEQETEGMRDIVSGSVGMNHALLLHADGTVTAVGAKQYDKAEVSGWTDITAVAAGAFHSVGLDAHGKVVCMGLDTDGQCQTGLWQNVTAIDAGLRHTVGLLSDGTVVAAGDNSFGQCEVSGWTDIVAIACGTNHTVGLKKDGTAVAAGDNGAGACEVDTWSHVLCISAGTWHTAALLEDGRVIAAGSNENDQCKTESMRAFRVTEYLVEPVKVRKACTELVYTGDVKNGPWVYYSKEGAVAISLDDSYDTVATRADLFCTAGVYLEGIFSGAGKTQPLGTSSGPELAQVNHAVFAINGDYFNFGYNPDGVQIRRGKVFKNVISAKKRSRGFAFWPDNSMRLVDPLQTEADDLIALGIRDSWVFGPLLVLNGEAQDISYSPLSYNDYTLRSAIGSVCACHHIALCCGKATLAEVTQLFLDYGCDIAYNLDGGRSVCMTFMGKRVNRTYFNKEGTRNLSDMIGFLRSDKVN